MKYVYACMYNVTCENTPLDHKLSIKPDLTNLQHTIQITKIDIKELIVNYTTVR